MTTLFLALQCVQCSTMQVKQQKKSSNKWVCAVCNQRQSVLCVHARGYRAADLRRYVQGANLSRGRGEPAPEVDWCPAAAGEQRDEVPRERRRMDWSEYLDDPGECDGGGGFAGARDGGIAIEVTTELPQESRKVTSLKRLPKAQLGIAGKRPKSPINPTSSKRQRIESPCSATATAEAQKSKWSKYLDASFFEERSELEGFGQHRTELDECVTTEVVVDDEAHGDKKGGTPREGAKTDKGKILKVSWEGGADYYTAAKLEEIFKQFGKVEDIVIKTRKSRSRGSAIVVMASKEAAQSALENHSVYNVSSVTLTVATVQESGGLPARSTQTPEPRTSNIDGTRFSDLEASVFWKLQEAQKRKQCG